MTVEQHKGPGVSSQMSASASAAQAVENLRRAALALRAAADSLDAARRRR